jgi:hypothetical protein
MPSITYWSRLEPRPRAASFVDAIAARVRDPAWFLCRQWQLGEFQGEDAASPAFVTVRRRLGRLDSWSAPGGDPHPLTAAPLEAAVLGEEGDATDLGLAAEIGAAFEEALTAQGQGTLIGDFRSAFPIRPLSAAARQLDPAAGRIIDVLAGRRVDGISLLAAAADAAPDLPAPTPADSVPRAAVRAALAAANDLARASAAVPGHRDAATWRPDRLDYAVELAGHDPDGAPLRLTSGGARDGLLEWHAFDAQPPGAPPAADPVVDTRSLIPTIATFRGMPSQRFWAFENGSFNVAAVRPDKRELGKLLVIDYLLVHGVDWYSVPLRQPIGTIASIESITVRDVFGDTTEVPPTPASTGVDRFSLFTLSVPGANPLPWLFLPHTAGPSVLRGDPREEVRFSRDELANLAWAIERTLPDPAGHPRSATERAARAPATDLPATSAADLVYRIQTDVPLNWFPLLPVALAPGSPEVALERGVLLRDAGAAPEPSGRILNPSSLNTPYRLAEDALPRTGITVTRGAHLARTADGGTHLWLSRRRRRTSAQDTSSLRFDTLLPRR